MEPADVPVFGNVTERRTIRFERRLPGPIERAWSYLVDSEKRGRWLAKGELEPWVGGRIDHVFRHAELSPTIEPIPDRYREMENGHAFAGRITRYDPPHVLAYTWGEGEDASEVTFELAPLNDEVLLTLTHRRLGDRTQRVSVASGWHSHLAILQDEMYGRDRRPFWSTHAAFEVVYDRRLPAGED